MLSRAAFVIGMTTTAAALSPDLAPAYARALGQASGIDGAVAITSGSEVHVAVTRSLPDVEANKKRRQTLRYRLDDGSLRRAGELADDPESVVGRCRAASGKLAVFSKTDEGSVVEIYEEDVLVQRIALDKKKVGKLLIGDAMVGGASWSADEALLAFVADAPAPEQKAAFDGQFRFREELGEKYVPRRRRSLRWDPLMRRWRRGVSRASPLVILHRRDAASTPSPRRRIDAIAATSRHQRRSASPHLASTSSIYWKTRWKSSSPRRTGSTRASRPSRRSGRGSWPRSCGVHNTESWG